MSTPDKFRPVRVFDAGEFIGWMDARILDLITEATEPGPLWRIRLRRLVSWRWWLDRLAFNYITHRPRRWFR